ncbi:AtpZ/AtpI family protein [Salipaludibacillus sp. CF4.18]|uniref:AtpZ/AtpI family protein n=1 Tax=Salipaludibacillus sp. CF4.18 TaxID=3373081 RepID=UPI003EE6B0C5
MSSVINKRKYESLTMEYGEIMSQPSRVRSVVKALALMTTISSYFIGSIVIGVFAGIWLDNYFNTSGVFLIVGFFLGLGTAVMGIYYAVRKFLGGNQYE